MEKQFERKDVAHTHTPAEHTHAYTHRSSMHRKKLWDVLTRTNKQKKEEEEDMTDFRGGEKEEEFCGNAQTADADACWIVISLLFNVLSL